MVYLHFFVLLLGHGNNVRLLHYPIAARIHSVCTTLTEQLFFIVIIVTVIVVVIFIPFPEVLKLCSNFA